jgi:hypothetical protein
MKLPDKNSDFMKKVYDQEKDLVMRSQLNNSKL